MNQVSWTSILIGLALFLFGIDYLSLSLQELSPTRLKIFLLNVLLLLLRLF